MESMVWREFEPGGLVKLYTAIGAASAALPDLPRNATGMIARGAKFSYAPYRTVVKCIKTPLAENGVTFLQPLHSEENGKVSITLLVVGHGAEIASTLKVDQDSDPKVFGANATYYKRYQLTNFFGLEGDPDADDFDLPVPESKPVVSQPKPEAPKPVAAKVVETKPEAAVENKGTETNPSVAAIKADTRSIGEKLTDAKKQLCWEMADFDKFCKELPEEFPDFQSASRLSPEGKVKLYELLVLKKGVAPF